MPLLLGIVSCLLLCGVLATSCDSETEETSQATVLLGVEASCAARARAVTLTITTGDREDSSAQWSVDGIDELPISQTVSLPSEPGAMHKATATFTLAGGDGSGDDSPVVSTLVRFFPDGADTRVVITLACVCAGKQCGAGQNCAEIPAGSGQAVCVDQESCGNGRCETAEDCSLCPADCACTCGNGSCGDDEDCFTCPVDCGTCCGNAVCDADENCASCPADCGCVCGDAACDALEGPAVCCTDCGGCDDTNCGNDVCEATEDPCSCVADCGGCCADTCGDGLCNCGETCATCAADCPDPCCGASCGDGTCSCGETCESCPADCPSACCGVTCGDGQCQDECGETSCACPSDCGTDPCCDASCGDGQCQASCGENSCSCPLDCTTELCCPANYKECDGECIPVADCCCEADEWCDGGTCRPECSSWRIEQINGVPVGGTSGSCTSYPCAIAYSSDCPLPPPQLEVDGVCNGSPYSDAPISETIGGTDGSLSWTQYIDVSQAPAVYTNDRMHRPDADCVPSDCPRTNSVSLTFYCPSGTKDCNGTCIPSTQCCCTGSDWCDSGDCRPECTSWRIHAVNSVVVDTTSATCTGYPCTVEWWADCSRPPPQLQVDGLLSGTPFDDVPISETIGGSDGNLSWQQVLADPGTPQAYTGLVIHRPDSLCAPQQCPVSNAVSVTLP